MATDYERNWPNRIPLFLFKMIINLWPPYLGAGIKIKKITADFRYIEVHLKLKWYNKNFVGTHYGGSIYSMSDAFYMLMLIKNLGSQYIIWDKAAQIVFKKPGRGTLRAVFTLSEEEIQAIRQQADKNIKYTFDRIIDILNQNNEVVASVTKTLFVQCKINKTKR